MKRLLIAFVFIISVFSVNATVVQKIFLKNGSVLNGYIQMQDGLGRMTVATESAIICLKNVDLSVSMGRLENANSLSDNWKTWAKNYDAFTNEGNVGKLLLTDVKLGTGSLDPVNKKKMTGFELYLHKIAKSFVGVYILEKGSNIRFQEMSPNIYEISWSDIVSISSDRRPKNALSGIDRKYTLKSNREVSGQYAGETETTISMYQSNGVIETIDYSDIVKIGYYGINPEQDIFAQSELLDVVNTRANGSIRGIIIEQNYSSDKDNENYISIWVKDRSPQMIKISEIKDICKEENTAYYAPKFDIVLKEGQVVVNRNEVRYVGISEHNNKLVLDSLGNMQQIDFIVNGETHVVLEMKQSADLSADTYQLVAVKNVLGKKDSLYGFTYKDLVDSPLRPISEETSINKTVKVDYIIKRPGTYALYDSKHKRAILLNVK